MFKTAFFLIMVVVCSMAAVAQPSAKSISPDDQSAMDMAKATLAAHGGDKLRALRSMLAKGSADMNVMGQTMSGVFSTAFKGDKYYFELISPAQSLKQVSNGQSTYTSVQGFYLPPVASVGFPVLAHVGDAGYVTAAVGDPKKKGKGFRITTPEGYFTDFFVDEKTKQLKSYESSYDMGGGRTVTTSVALDAFENIDGVLAPKKYSQRFDLGTFTAYVSFTAKTLTINQPIDDSAFDTPRQ